MNSFARKNYLIHLSPHCEFTFHSYTMASAHVAEYNRILVHDIESKSSLVCHYLGDSGCVVRQYIFFFFFQFEGLGITCNIYIRRKLMENIRINICNITISSCSIDKIRDITKQKLIRDYIAVMPACLSLCSNIHIFTILCKFALEKIRRIDENYSVDQLYRRLLHEHVCSWGKRNYLRD